MVQATISYISGPLLRAKTDDAFSMYEAVKVGKEGLLGEVIRLDEGQITVQVYEDTTGLAPGAPVQGQGLPLSVDLGPGILGGIFDGLLRPLRGLEGGFVPRGERDPRNTRLHFAPTLRVGDTVTGGQVLGRFQGQGVIDQQALTPPGLAGEITWIAREGSAHERDRLCTIESVDGQRHDITGLHAWPVRLARPIQERRPTHAPLVTGQRILDSLLPIALGGKAAIPGGFGTGKTVLLETLAKFCNADIIVYVGCGERGNELTGVLEEFPELEDPRTGRPLMERTVIIANTSNMPVAAREASIYTGVTVAEYFRDQGLHVALMADSTSRWAEALREISGRLGELPGEGGYPAYLSSRLADFYERAAVVTTLNGELGSVTLMGAVSPPSGDFSEPVVTHTKRYVRCFWALDAKRAQARMYPAVNPLQSYSEEARLLAGWWQEQGGADWLELRQQLLTLLGEQIKLERMARIIGRDALPYPQQMRLFCANLVNESFLVQSAFSPTDRYCSPQRQLRMLKLLTRFTELAMTAVANGVKPEAIAELPIYRRLQRMGEEIGEDQLSAFDTLQQQLEEGIQGLSEGAQAALEEERNA